MSKALSHELSAVLPNAQNYKVYEPVTEWLWGYTFPSVMGLCFQFPFIRTMFHDLEVYANKCLL